MNIDYLMKGLRLARASKHASAHATFSTGIGQHSVELAELYFWRAYVQWQWLAATDDRASCEKALADIDRAIAFAPQDARSHFERGRILFWLERVKDALPSFAQAAALEPDSARYSYFLVAATAQATDGMGIESQSQVLDWIISRGYRSANVYNLLGVSHYAAERYGEAAEAFRTAQDDDIHAELFTCDACWNDAWRHVTRVRLGEEHASREAIRRRLDRLGTEWVESQPVWFGILECFIEARNGDSLKKTILYESPVNWPSIAFLMGEYFLARGEIAKARPYYRDAAAGLKSWQTFSWILRRRIEREQIVVEDVSSPES